jgi:hypothetical protein
MPGEHQNFIIPHFAFATRTLIHFDIYSLIPSMLILMNFFFLWEQK